MCVNMSSVGAGADPKGGGFLGLQTPPPPNGQSYDIECSIIDVLSHGDALIYLAKRSVVVVAKF